MNYGGASTQPTPGHGGKVCAERHELNYSLWTESQGRWYYGLKNGLHFRTVGCPACGIRLVRDEAPLPVREGYGPVQSQLYQGGPLWMVLAVHHSQNGWIKIVRATKEEAEEEWRRRFGERK